MLIEVGEQPTDVIGTVPSLTVIVCESLLQPELLHAWNVLVVVAAVLKLGLNDLLAPLDGLPPGAVHDRDVTVSVMVGEQLTACPVVTVTGEHPKDRIRGRESSGAPAAGVAPKSWSARTTLITSSRRRAAGAQSPFLRHPLRRCASIESRRPSRGSSSVGVA